MKKILKKIPFIQWILNFSREIALIRFEALRQTRIQQAILRELLIQNHSKDNLTKLRTPNFLPKWRRWYYK